MKTLMKVLIVLIVLVFCVPANGEILIYQKTIRGFDCNSLDDQWEVNERRDRGYLILEIEYDSEGEEQTIEVINAVQIEYFKEDDSKWYVVDEMHSFWLIRADYNGKIAWILLESSINIIIGDVDILMLQGLAADCSIGLGTDVQREAAKRLKGNFLSDQQLSINHTIETLRISLRLHSQWTKIANNPNRLNGSFDDAVADVEAGLIKRGYEEL
jgi:hypothetical protein